MSEKYDWKLANAYNVLEIPINEQEELELDWERIGEITPGQFEKIVDTVSHGWHFRVRDIIETYRDHLTPEQKKALRDKAFVSYEKFLKLHKLTFLDWKDTKSFYVDWNDPNFVYDEDKDFGTIPAPYTHKDFHRYFRKFIHDKVSYDNFCYNFPPTLEGYLKLLSQSGAKKLNSFFLQSKLWCYIRAKDRAKHTYITGSSGSGKSELIKFIIYSELKKQRRRGHIGVSPAKRTLRTFYQ